MSRKYFQAKKTTSNPFAINQQYNKSQKHRFMVISLSLFVGFVLLSSVASMIYRAVKGDQVVDKPERKASIVSDKPKVKDIKPIADADFKGAKQYNFYTQLEERSLDLGGSDRFGGVAIDSVHMPLPSLQLESMGGGESSNVAMAPLVLESANPSDKIDVVVKEKTVPAVAKNAPDDNVSKNRTINLQIGSFVAQSEAVNHRTKLEMYGFSPQIIKGTNKENKIVYRVHLGPFSSKELPSIKARLNALGVSFFEVK